MGLNDENGITLQGLHEVEMAENVFIECYTNILSSFSMRNFEQLGHKSPSVVTRKNLEDESGKIVLDASERSRTVLLVPGDPMIATTHVALAVAAAKRGIKTRIVHGASIVSAAIGSCGLHSYKFGKTVTIPFPETATAETPYAVIMENKVRALHTLCLLDIDIENNRFLSIAAAIHELSLIENERAEGAVGEDVLAVGLSRLGSSNAIVKADWVRMLPTFDFGKAPHTLIFPARLHFMEAEALVSLAGAPEEIKKESD